MDPLMPVKNRFLRFFYGTAAKTPFGASFLKTLSKSQSRGAVKFPSAV